MSKAVRLGVGILAVLVVVSVGVAVYLLIQKQDLEQQNLNLHDAITKAEGKVKDLQGQVKKWQGDAQALTEKVNQTQHDKDQVQAQYDEAKQQVEEIQSQVDQITRERDDWKDRLETIRHERDDLLEKLKNRPAEVAEAPKPPASEQPAAQPEVVGDEYWAGILKQKAALQMELEKAKADVDQAVLQVADLKKQNSDLQLEIKSVTNEKEEIERKIKYGEDLANNLSIEIARSRNDQKFVNERADKLKEENLALQGQIKELSSTKVALEKTISRMSDDKDAMQKKLVETENVIQGRIDEIWQIKQSLDKKMADMKPAASAAMELPPIIVNAGPNTSNAPVAAPQPPKDHGAIISMNESNNFVIVDLGQDTGVKVGQALSVYRDNQAIASLEIIQVRKDICAADIKDKSVALKVGDTVKFN